MLASSVANMSLSPANAAPRCSVSGSPGTAQLNLANLMDYEVILVSKSGYQYKGKLCALDSHKLTVSLGDVVILEPVSGVQGEMKEGGKVYERIDFKSSNLEDLKVVSSSRTARAEVTNGPFEDKMEDKHPNIVEPVQKLSVEKDPAVIHLGKEINLKPPSSNRNPQKDKTHFYTNANRQQYHGGYSNQNHPKGNYNGNFYHNQGCQQGYNYQNSRWDYYNPRYPRNFDRQNRKSLDSFSMMGRSGGGYYNRTSHTGPGGQGVNKWVNPGPYFSYYANSGARVSYGHIPAYQSNQQFAPRYNSNSHRFQDGSQDQQNGHRFNANKGGNKQMCEEDTHNRGDSQPQPHGKRPSSGAPFAQGKAHNKPNRPKGASSTANYDFDAMNRELQEILEKEVIPKQRELIVSATQVGEELTTPLDRTSPDGEPAKEVDENAKVTEETVSENKVATEESPEGGIEVNSPSGKSGASQPIVAAYPAFARLAGFYDDFAPVSSGPVGSLGQSKRWNESKLNKETFGEAMVRRRSSLGSNLHYYYGHGGYGNYGGYGGHRNNSFHGGHKPPQAHTMKPVTSADEVSNISAVACA